MKSNDMGGGNNYDHEEGNDDDEMKKFSHNPNRAPANIFSGQVKEPTMEASVSVVDLSADDGLMNKKLNINNLNTVPTQFDVFKIDFYDEPTLASIKHFKELMKKKIDLSMI